MRAWLVFMLLVPFVSGLLVESTGIAGDNPVLYGNMIVYERDNHIFVYDISQKVEREVASGSNPSFFGFVVAFETKESDVDLNNDGDKNDVVVQYANVRDKTITSTNAVGHHPNIFSSFIVFSTKESELGIDFSNDGDLDDDIVRMYDMDKKEVSNLKAVGDFPVMNQRALLFITQEKQVGTDLNADGDKLDVILRVFDKESRKVDSIIPAGKVVLAKSNNAVFDSDGKLVVFDAVEHKAVETGIIGTSPAIFGDVAVFERDNNLYGFSLKSKRVAKMNVLGSSPSLFEKVVVFVSSEKELGDLNNNGKDEFIIRYAREEDIDGDDVYDFIDNCPSVINVDQVDADNDGVGDACEKESKKSVEIAGEKSESNVTRNESEIEERAGEFYWYHYLLIVLLLPVLFFVFKFGFRYYKRRKKSFGF